MAMRMGGKCVDGKAATGILNELERPVRATRTMTKITAPECRSNHPRPPTLDSVEALWSPLKGSAIRVSPFPFLFRLRPATASPDFPLRALQLSLWPSRADYKRPRSRSLHLL